jgi:hypothetical protein
MTPFGPTGKKVELYKFQPIIIIPIWNAWSLLWTYVHRPSRRASKKDVRGTNILYNGKPPETIMIIQPVQNLRPSMVNVTFSPHQ